MTRTLLCGACALFSTSPAVAQEMLNMPSATAPSPGVIIPRAQLRAYAFERDQWLVEQAFRVDVGVVRDVSVSADLSLFQGFLDGPRPSDGEFGLGDLECAIELRVLREDLNAIDTVRAAVFAGTEIPTGTEGFGGDSADPFAGAVITAILGRHGVDAAARFTFVTGGGVAHPIFASDTADDFANLDVGYAYRLYPEEYGEEREGAWYATLEINSILTTGGEHEVLLSPGVLLEAPEYALELGLHVPISDDRAHMPALRLGVLLGVRLIF